MKEETVNEIFQQSFVDITKKLVGLSLQEREQPEDLLEKNRIFIFISGFLDSGIVCAFSSELFEYIAEVMYGGALPSQEEQILYLKEYINIVCGRAVSKVNNITGSFSRLSVPYYNGEIPIPKEERPEKIFLYYESDHGDMQIEMDYLLHKDLSKQ